VSRNAQEIRTIRYPILMLMGPKDTMVRNTTTFPARTAGGRGYILAKGLGPQFLISSPTYLTLT
jgi:hypothetical protein